MARRDRSTSSTQTEGTEPTSTTQSDPTEEAAVTTATEETVPAQAEASTTEAAPAAESTSGKSQKAADVDLTAFTAAVQTAVAQRDESTGDLAVEAIAPVVTEYRAIDGIAGKNKAKGVLTDAMKEAMNKLDIQLARSYMLLQENLSAGTPTKAEKAPADPTEAYVQRTVGLDLARALLAKPEGVADDADQRAEKLYGEVYPVAQAYLAWANDESEGRGEEPDAPAFVKNAVKLAQGKAAKVGGTRAGGSGGGSGERHDIGEHIRQAFENVDSGTFLTIAEIRNAKSTEYGDNPPSAGAISARLFPSSGKCTLEFVTPGQNEKGNRGATKV